MGLIFSYIGPFQEKSVIKRGFEAHVYVNPYVNDAVAKVLFTYAVSCEIYIFFIVSCEICNCRNSEKISLSDSWGEMINIYLSRLIPIII